VKKLLDEIANTFTEAPIELRDIAISAAVRAFESRLRRKIAREIRAGICDYKNQPRGITEPHGGYWKGREDEAAVCARIALGKKGKS